MEEVIYRVVVQSRFKSAVNSKTEIRVRCHNITVSDGVIISKQAEVSRPHDATKSKDVVRIQTTSENTTISGLWREATIKRTINLRENVNNSVIRRGERKHLRTVSNSL